MTLLHTTRFRRRKLPHWEVEGGRYFVTVRLADSLPRSVVLRLQEIHREFDDIESQSPQFSELQRQYFRTLEKYLDAGLGACFLETDAAAACVARELEQLCEWDVTVPHFTIMPNHWHALLVPATGSPRALSEIMKRVKGRTGLAIRKSCGGAGPVWQAEWFDRWIRNEAEWDKTVRYIQQNPTKAGITRSNELHRWTR